MVTSALVRSGRRRRPGWLTPADWQRPIGRWSLTVLAAAGLAVTGLRLAEANPAVLITIPGPSSNEPPPADPEPPPTAAAPEPPPPEPLASPDPTAADDADDGDAATVVPTPGGGPDLDGNGPGGGEGEGPGDGDGAGATTTTTVATTTTAPAPPEPPLAFGTNSFPRSLGPGHTGADTVRALEDIVPGTPIVRFTVAWQSMQLGTRLSGEPCGGADIPGQCAVPGEISFDYLDDDLAPLAAAGFQVVLAPVSAPPWARNLLDVATPNQLGQFVTPPIDSPDGAAHWRAFVAALVDHVQTNFPGILRGIEIWNEPNGRMFWTTLAGPDPVRYTKLLCAGYEAVKSVDPTVPVIFGGTHPEPPNWLGHSVQFDDFIDLAYRAGAGRCLDTVGIHAYPVTGDDRIAGFTAVLDEVRAVLARHGDAGRTMSITEVTIDHPADAPIAEFLVNAYQLAAEMPDIDMFIVHTLFDYPGDDAGICRAPHASKAPASALKHLFTGSTEPATC